MGKEFVKTYWKIPSCLYGCKILPVCCFGQNGEPSVVEDALVHLGARNPRPPPPTDWTPYICAGITLCGGYWALKNLDWILEQFEPQADRRHSKVPQTTRPIHSPKKSQRNSTAQVQPEQAGSSNKTTVIAIALVLTILTIVGAA